jgi:ribonuclease BN (tRNA processing enzyme)
MDRRHSLDIYVLMTHIHWDHLMGFPFFMPIFQDDAHIVVDGCRACMQGLQHVFSNTYVDGTWPVRFDDLRAHITHTTDLLDGQKIIGATTVESHGIQHPQGGLGFRFTEETRSMVFLTDNELRDDGWNGTRFSDFVTFCRDADLLIHDCQYLSDEIDIRRGWGHSDLASVAKLAIQAEVKHLVLFHHDPWRKDREVSRIVHLCKEIFDKAGVDIAVEGAREGSTLGL